MQRLTSDAQLAQIWELAREEGIAPNASPTVDRWGDPFTVFDGWGDVEAIAQIVYANFTVLATDSAPKWEHLPEEQRPNPYHHIEWAIGDFGFYDNFQLCSHCQTATQTDDPHPDHYVDDAGDLICGDCLRKDKDWADDYLTWAAYYLEEHGHCIYTRMAHPGDHGFVCVNGHHTQFCESDYHDDHPQYKGTLTWADPLELRRLAKAARLVDPAIQIVFNYTYTFSGANVIWARFNPNEDISTPNYHLGQWYEFSHSEASSGEILGYALGRVFAKYELLRRGAKS